VIKLQVIAQARKISVTEFFTSAPNQGVRLTDEEDRLLQAFRKVKSVELRECLLKLTVDMNRRLR